jgi:hypothetical protein
MSFKSKLSRANKHSVYDLVMKRNSYLEKNLSNHTSTVNGISLRDADINTTKTDLKIDILSPVNQSHRISPKVKRFFK